VFYLKDQEDCQDPLRIIGRAKGYSKKEILTTLPRHSKCNPQLLKELIKLPNFILRNSGTSFAKKITKMMKEVSLEAYRAKQFTRTEINHRGVLYGLVSLEHRVIDIILNYFHKRWPSCVICLFNEKNCKTSIINEEGIIYENDSSLEKTVQEIGSDRPIQPYFEDIQISGDEIFKTLYESQNIDERINQRYFKSMVPNYCYKLPGMRKGVEKNFTPKNKKLDDFF